MKNPYPVAFVITVVLCALIIGYHMAFQGDDDAVGRPSASIAADDARPPAPTSPSRLTAPPSGSRPITFDNPRDDSRTPTGDAVITRPSLADRPQAAPDQAPAIYAPDPTTGVDEPTPPASRSTTRTPAAVASPATPAPAMPAATPPTAPATSPAPRAYTIKAGDSFASIALAIYGSDSYWHLIGQANPLVDPAKLKPGQVINLPAADVIREQREAATTGDSRTPEYVVRAGDTLWNIAVQHYENGRLWRHIYSANRGLIGPNPDKLEAGMKLRIPPPPEGAQ